MLSGIVKLMFHVYAIVADFEFPYYILNKNCNTTSDHASLSRTRKSDIQTHRLPRIHRAIHVAGQLNRGRCGAGLPQAATRGSQSAGAACTPAVAPQIQVPQPGARASRHSSRAIRNSQPKR